MAKSGDSELESIAGALESLLAGRVPEPVVCGPESGEAAMRASEAVNGMIEAVTGSREFMLALADGRLDVEAPRTNFLVSPFKQLQSNLRHLVWQTHEISRGDLDQHVDFLGEFSDSFNSMIATLRDKKAIEDALAASEKRLEDITAAVGDGVIMLDTEGRVVFLNPAAEQMLGWPEKELPGKNLHQTVHFRRPDGSEFPETACPAARTLASGDVVRVHDDLFIRHDGSPMPVAYISTPIMEDGRVTGSVVAFHDITSRKLSQEALERANELLQREATMDALTGIANRRKYDDALAVEIARVRRHPAPLSVMMFDIDNFKLVNDSYGHHIGDLVLVELAQLVRNGLRFEDVFARWGGEEFVILLPQTDLAAGAELAERLRREVQRNHFSTADSVTCSFGVARLRKDDDAGGLMRRVDRALYRAKNSGRNRVLEEEPVSA